MSLRKASSGTLASTTMSRPPGMCTIMSGRRRPSSVVVDTCSSKSQCSSMPAISTTRRSWISPQRPRVWGERRAVTRLRVSLLELLVSQVELGQLLAQPLVGALPIQLDLPQPELVARQRLAQRVEQLRDGLLALGEVALGRRAGLVEFRVGQGQELLVVAGQGLGRQLGEGAGQADPLLLCPRRRPRRRTSASARARWRPRHATVRPRPPRPSPPSAPPRARRRRTARRPGGSPRGAPCRTGAPFGRGAMQRRWPVPRRRRVPLRSPRGQCNDGVSQLRGSLPTCWGHDGPRLGVVRTRRTR